LLPSCLCPWRSTITIEEYLPDSSMNLLEGIVFFLFAELGFTISRDRIQLSLSSLGTF
jgi:hypothetical protein